MGLGFHDLRRLAGTTLVAEGVDVKTAQHRLGHASPQVTLALYAQAVTTNDRDAADRVARRLGPEGNVARDERAMTENLEGDDPGDTVIQEGEFGGASWNRTSDLSIISAAL